ncbi:MAG: GIY-YIG nuclease family protein [Candidatus Marinimicrobia bacterium]|nr:GIY-YIG nuclease family protein [Candidatus Neomarinimicrobiota bacterium]
MNNHNYYVYILTNFTKKVLYTGVTNNLAHRLYEHRYVDKYSFCYKYRCYYLIYYDWFQDINQAIENEKRIKGWTRVKKIKLIKTMNPEMKFLNDLLEDPY